MGGEITDRAVRVDEAWLFLARISKTHQLHGSMLTGKLKKIERAGLRAGRLKQRERLTQSAQ
jgi:hypothetical protein